MLSPGGRSFRLMCALHSECKHGEWTECWRFSVTRAHFPGVPPAWDVKIEISDSTELENSGRIVMLVFDRGLFYLRQSSRNMHSANNYFWVHTAEHIVYLFIFYWRCKIWQIFYCKIKWIKTMCSRPLVVPKLQRRSLHLVCNGIHLKQYRNVYSSFCTFHILALLTLDKYNRIEKLSFTYNCIVQFENRS